MSVAAERRRSLLTAALGFLQLPPQTSALRALHAWLDSWSMLVIGWAMGQLAWLILRHRGPAWIPHSGPVDVTADHDGQSEDSDSGHGASPGASRLIKANDLIGPIGLA